jgi:PadR family transcriptional regulator, regulatory protein PadR
VSRCRLFDCKPTDLRAYLPPFRTENRSEACKAWITDPDAIAAVQSVPLAYREETGILPSVTVSKPSDLVQGTLDLLLLKILELGPMHGWAISRRLNQMSHDVLHVSDGSLYPALHKLEHQGWIKSDWRPSENNRRAKFYSLTRAGRSHLSREAEDWRRLSGAISALLKLNTA